MPVPADRCAMTAPLTVPKIITLRYAGTCRTCGAALPEKSEAVCDRATRVVLCLACSSTVGAPVLPERSVSVAGASAQAEFERRLATDLGRLLGDRAVFFHDRKVGRANIDHLIVAPSGVWVVDAKNYKGRVEHREAGGWLGPATWRIYVGDRDRTKLAAGLEWQVGAVRNALAGLDAPIRPALCFPRKGWGWFAKPFLHDGVLVTWSEKLAEVVDAPGELQAERMEEVVARLRAALPAAT